VSFPTHRPRRLRRTPALRRLVAETRLSVDDLVAPLFVREGLEGPPPSLRCPASASTRSTRSSKRPLRLADLGVPALVLFGVPVTKDENGSGAWDPDGIVQVALAELRAALGDQLVLMADLCLDEYTLSGTAGCSGPTGRSTTTPPSSSTGAWRSPGPGRCPRGGPSGMMDGQVEAIRRALDADGHIDTAILAYAAKYASALYGPFREAVDVAIAEGGDRTGYQQDSRNRREALAEVALDVAEGADMVMVKPALSYLDVIADVRRAVDLPSPPIT